MALELKAALFCQLKNNLFVRAEMVKQNMCFVICSLDRFLNTKNSWFCWQTFHNEYIFCRLKIY